MLKQLKCALRSTAGAKTVQTAKQPSNKLGIISYCDHFRTFAHINHQYYAEQHGYSYIFDAAPTHNGPYLNKIEKLLKFLDLFERVFWIDDDGFFTQYDQPLEKFLKKHQDKELVFCKSPENVDDKGNPIWTYLSSGNFFMKNTPRVRAFLEACMEMNLDDIRDKWDSEKFGHFTNGDQDIMVYLLHNDDRFNGPDFHVCLPYENFNTRPFHFKKKANEHFLVHFTGNDKQGQAVAFGERLGLSEALVPQAVYESYKGRHRIEDSAA